MATIEKLIQNTKALNFNKVVSDVLHESQPELIKAQQDQMMHGLSATGKIGTYANPDYSVRKFKMSALAGFGNVDLRFKGSFQKMIKVYFFSKSFFFRSTDYKYEHLIYKYGEDIMGLNVANQGKISVEVVKPKAVKLIKEQIFKK